MDATLFLLWMCLDEQRVAPEQQGGFSDAQPFARSFLSRWALGPNYAAWLIYLLVIGPFGATGIRSAEQIVGAVWGP
jgi:hypothetical protein